MEVARPGCHGSIGVHTNQRQGAGRCNSQKPRVWSIGSCKAWVPWLYRRAHKPEARSWSVQQPEARSVVKQERYQHTKTNQAHSCLLHDCSSLLSLSENLCSSTIFNFAAITKRTHAQTHTNTRKAFGRAVKAGQHIAAAFTILESNSVRLQLEISETQQRHLWKKKHVEQIVHTTTTTWIHAVADTRKKEFFFIWRFKNFKTVTVSLCRRQTRPSAVTRRGDKAR